MKLLVIENINMRNNKEITEALTSHNRNSVPLYVYYKKGAKTPQYLPQILTTEILNNTFQ